MSSVQSFVPLACAAAWAQNEPLLASLPPNSRAELTAVDGMGRDALMYGASVANRRVVALVLQKGGNARNTDSIGNSALHYAVIAGHLGIVEDLLAAGSLLSAQNHAGETPLFLAVRERHTALARFLLERYVADPNVATAPHQVSPLHVATANADVDACRLLLQGGAYVNAQDDEGETPLHYSVCDYEGDPTIIRLLVEEAGADVAVRNSDGETPAEIAAAAGMTDVVKYLNERASGQRSGPGRLAAAAEEAPSSVYVPEQPYNAYTFTSAYVF